MDGHAQPRPAEDAAPGSLRRALTAAPLACRRAVEWLLGDRDAIDQQGLLAERTLFPPPHRPARAAGERPRSRGDEAR